MLASTPNLASGQPKIVTINEATVTASVKDHHHVGEKKMVKGKMVRWYDRDVREVVKERRKKWKKTHRKGLD